MRLSGWIKFLRDSDKSVRDQALAALTELGKEHPQPVVAALLDYLTDQLSRNSPAQPVIGSGMMQFQSVEPTAETAAEVVPLLLQICDDPAVKDRALLLCMQSTIDPVQRRALRAIAKGESNSEQLIPLVIRALESNPNSLDSVRALGQFGPRAKEVVPVLTRAWISRQSPSAQTMAAAPTMAAPGIAGSADFHRFRSSNDHRQFAMQAAIAVALARIDVDAGLPVLFELFDHRAPTDVPDRSQDRPDAEAEQLLAELVEILGDGIQLLAAATPPTPRAVPALVKALRFSEPGVADAASSALEKINTATQRTGYVELILQPDAERQDRNTAARRLTELGAEGAAIQIPRLLTGLQQTSAVAAASATALAGIAADREQAGPAIAAAFQRASTELATAQDENASGTMRGATSGRRILPNGQSATQSAVVDAATAEENQRAIGLALIRVDAPRAVPLLIESIVAEDHRLVRVAVEVLMKVPSPPVEAVPGLTSGLSRDPETAASCARALGLYGSGAASAGPALAAALERCAKANSQYQARNPRGLRGNQPAMPFMGVAGLNPAAIPTTPSAAADQDQDRPELVVGRTLIQVAPMVAVPALIRLLDPALLPRPALAAQLLGEMGPAARAALPELAQANQSAVRGDAEDLRTIQLALARIRGIELPAGVGPTLTMPLAQFSVEAPVFSLVPMPDGSRFVGNLREELALFDGRTGKQLATLEGSAVGLKARQEPFDVAPVAVAADGKSVAFGGRQYVALWNSTDGSLIDKLRGHARDVDLDAVIFSRTGDRLASAGTDGIRVWTGAGNPVAVIPFKSPARAARLGISQDGQRLAASLRDGTIAVYAATTGKQEHTIAPSLPNAYEYLRSGYELFAAEQLEFSPDGTQLAAVGAFCPADYFKPRGAQDPPATKNPSRKSVRQKENDESLSPLDRIQGPARWNRQRGPDCCCVWDLESGRMVNCLQASRLAPDGQTLAQIEPTRIVFLDASSGLMRGQIIVEKSPPTMNAVDQPDDVLRFSLDAHTLFLLSPRAQKVTVWELDAIWPH